MHLGLHQTNIALMCIMKFKQECAIMVSLLLEIIQLPTTVDKSLCWEVSQRRKADI